MAYTKNQWYAFPDFQKELAELLKHPTMVIALDMVKEQGMKSTLTPGGLDLIHFYALMGAKKDGCIETVQNLQDLTQAPKALMPERKPWDTPGKKPPLGDADTSSSP